MSACGGSFVNSPSCADDPKNKTLIQKIICQGQQNPVDSITFALFTSATVPAVIAQTAKWIRCGKPSKGAPYAYGALALWGLEVARSINNIYNDEKNLGEEEKPNLGEDEATIGYVMGTSDCEFISNAILGPNGQDYQLPNPTTQEQDQLNAAKTPQDVYNVLKSMLRDIGLDSTFEDGILTLTVPGTGENICFGGGGSDGGDY